jgi:CRP-like cAMP-binding protein
MAGQLQLTRIKYAKDAYIVFEGKPNADRFFIVQEGKVRIIREVDKITEQKEKKQKQENLVGPGDIIAAVSAMAGYSYIETAVALTSATVVAVDKAQYGDLIRSNAPIARKIILQFSRRLRDLGDMLSERAFSGTVTHDTSHLLEVADYYLGQRKYNQAFYVLQQYAAYNPQAENLSEIKKTMMKIAPSVKVVKPVFPPNEMRRKYPKECILCAESEKGNELYIIQKGSVKISKIVNKQEMVLAVFKSGDIVGEMALLEDKPRSATVEALEDCVVLAVNRDNFEELITQQPDLVSRLTTLMAERIWFIYKQLANTLIVNPLGRIYDALLIQLEKDRVDVSTNQAHQLDFSFRELAGLAGIPAEESEALLKRILMTKRIVLVQDKLYITDASDVLRQTEYYRRTQRIHSGRSDPG